MRRAYTFCRYAVAAILFWYGFAKLTGAQFTILDSELDKPLGEVSGFWLTWYYFGYSAIYGNALALVQIGAGVLLLFRRTTLLGASILFGVMANIVLIDIFYGVAFGALVAAVLLLAALSFILSQHRRELGELFWTRQNTVYAGDEARRSPAWLRHAVRLALVAVAALGTYYIANFNNRVPTPLDGRWAVEAAEGLAAPVPSMLYFERNRAFMAVVRTEHEGRSDWAERHFEVDGDRLGIWTRWLSKGDPIFAGTWSLDGERLRLDGDWNGRPAALQLRRTSTL